MSGQEWLCRRDPDMWFSRSTADRGVAIHICVEHCPSYAECTLEPPAVAGVLAGIAYGPLGEPLRRQPRAQPCLDCRPLPLLRERLPAADTGACGTTRGYNRHQYLKEKACEPCRKARNARRREGRRAVVPVPVCGTPQGYRKHLRTKVPTCEPCRRAWREYIEELKRSA